MPWPRVVALRQVSGVILSSVKCQGCCAPVSSVRNNLIMYIKCQGCCGPVSSLRSNVTGWTAILATPQKIESQTWGEEKKQSPRTPPMSGTLFFGGWQE